MIFHLKMITNYNKNLKKEVNLIKKYFNSKYKIFNIVGNWVIDLIDRNILHVKQKENQTVFCMVNKKHNQNQMKRNKVKVNQKLSKIMLFLTKSFQ